MSCMHSAVRLFLAYVVAVRINYKGRFITALDCRICWNQSYGCEYTFKICHNLILLTCSGNYLNNGLMSYLVRKATINLSCSWCYSSLSVEELVKFLFPVFPHYHSLGCCVCVSAFFLPAILSLLFFSSLLPTHSHCSLDVFDYLKPSLATFQIGFNIYQETTCCLDLRHESIHGWVALCSHRYQFLQLSCLDGHTA